MDDPMLRTLLADLTVFEGVLVLLVAWLVFKLVGLLAGAAEDAVRNRRGLPPVDHCHHCGLVDDQQGEIAEIRDRVDDLAGAAAKTFRMSG